MSTNGSRFTIVTAIAECCHIKFRHVRCEWFGENRWQLVKSSANRSIDGWLNPGDATFKSPRHIAWYVADLKRKPTMVSLKIPLDCFTVHGTTMWWRDFQVTQAHSMICGRLETKANDGLTKDTTGLFHSPWHDHVSEYFSYISNSKSNANNQNFERKLDLTWKVYVNQPKKTIGTLSNFFNPNRMILAGMGDELSREQKKLTETHTHTHRRRRWQCPKANTGLE